MRTLIIAAVAMAAFAAKADGIVSSSVVGYQNLDTESVGNVLITPTFLNVGETNKCYLSDLKVTGYSAPTPGKKTGTWNGGCGGGKFVVTLLTANGTSAGDYYWIDNGKLAAGWYQTAEGAAIEGGAEAVAIPAGQGLWTQGSGYLLNIPAPDLNGEDKGVEE